MLHIPLDRGRASCYDGRAEQRCDAQVHLCSLHFFREVSAMSKYSKEDIIRMAREGRRGVHPHAVHRHLRPAQETWRFTASQIGKAVNGQVMIDGSSIEGFTRIQESDQYLRPRPGFLHTILPWRPQHGKVARLICDVYNPDGTPFVGDPRVRAEKGASARGGHGLFLQRRPRVRVLPLPDGREGARRPRMTADEAGYLRPWAA